jgi:hypothetical protein
VAFLQSAHAAPALDVATGVIGSITERPLGSSCEMGDGGWAALMLLRDHYPTPAMAIPWARAAAALTAAAFANHSASAAASFLLHSVSPPRLFCSPSEGSFLSLPGYPATESAPVDEAFLDAMCSLVGRLGAHHRFGAALELVRRLQATCRARRLTAYTVKLLEVAEPTHRPL